MKQERLYPINPATTQPDAAGCASCAISRITRFLQCEAIMACVLFIALSIYASSLFAASAPELLYSTFLGNAGSDTGTGVAMDSEGNLYVAGNVRGSPNPVQSDDADNTDIYVAKLNPDGSQLLYLVYVGGSGDDFANDICVDSSGNAFVTGGTRSLDFPIVAATQVSHGGGLDAVVVQVDPSGTMAYSSYLGGENNDEGKGIACHGSGHVYVTGQTNSPDFPVMNAYKSVLSPSGGDAFITRINIPGSDFVYSTFLGGTLLDSGNGISVDGSGNAYITGDTDSQDFPLASPLQSTKGGVSPSSPDAFVVKLAADGSELLYATYIGGNQADKGNEVVVDANGNAYVTGSTYSPDFPVVRATQPSHGGKLDTFVAKINPAGSALVYSTFLGGTRSDLGNDIAIDAAGNAYITGSTDSNDFPMVSPVQAGYAGGARDAFVAKISPEGVSLFSSFHGGALFDEGASIAADNSGKVYITGRTTSATLPNMNAVQPAYGGGSFDPFIVKIATPDCSVTGRSERGSCRSHQSEFVNSNPWKRNPSEK